MSDDTYAKIADSAIEYILQMAMRSGNSNDQILHNAAAREFSKRMDEAAEARRAEPLILTKRQCHLIGSAFSNQSKSISDLRIDAGPLFDIRDEVKKLMDEIYEVWGAVERYGERL